MPKKRQIPNLFDKPLASGATVWHWKPSKSLRAAGFANVKLGTDMGVAVNRAIELNAQVDEWRRGLAAPREDGAPPARPLPRIVRFPELVSSYRKSPEFTELKPSTRREYGTRLGQLEYWAGESMAVRDIDKKMVEDLRKALLAKSKFKAAAMLRVLRLLLNWAIGEGIIAANPTDHVKVPEPPRRAATAPEDARNAIAIEGSDTVGLAQLLGFWTFQRQGDLLGLSRFQWRQLADVDPRDAAALANPKTGHVLGFRLQQRKTGAWIDAPVPPFLHARIEAAFAANAGGLLFPHPDQPGTAIPDWLFQRRYKEARHAAIDKAVATLGESAAVVAQLRACQFRDLRRTGMMYARDAGASIPQITALSGHQVFEKRTILDTYMPGDTRAAAACVATMLRHWHAQHQQKEAQG